MADFVVENKTQNCLNEIHIDKQDPHYSIITLRSGSAFARKVQEGEYPLTYTNINSIKFFIYNGSEEYLQGDKKFLNTLKLNKSWKECPERTWEIIDSFKVIRVVKTDAYPFMSLPTESAPPPINSKNQK